MSKSPALAVAGSQPGINDDIGEETRLALYRSQVVIRDTEQRAFDLFLQNLVKGTSHLSLGQEAVATGFAAAMRPKDLSFCTYRGHAHTLARGVPVEKVLDTTGAGDLFAAGFLYGMTNGLEPEESARLGGVCAAEVIAHVGARPEADLRALALAAGLFH